MDILYSIWDLANDNPEIMIVGSMTLIQITPIKIEPWTVVLRWLGKGLNGNVQHQLDNLSSDVVEMKKDFNSKIINDMRWNILNFSNSCKNGSRHTREQWHYTISQLAEYESYVKNEGVINGVMAEESKYLKKLYHESCEKNDFL